MSDDCVSAAWLRIRVYVSLSEIVAADDDGIYTILWLWCATSFFTPRGRSQKVNSYTEYSYVTRG